MLQQGHDVNSTDYDGRDALMLAAAAGQAECVKMLLSAGALPSRWV
jgi:ankyrin repeat protein